MGSIDPVDDLAVLNPPEIKGRIRGREIVFVEYSFIRELQLRVYSQPFINDLQQLMLSGESGMDQADALFAKHIDNIVQLMLAACPNLDLDFINSLSRPEGRELLDMWWRANGDFFISCATDYARDSLRTKILKMKAAGQIPTPPSSQTDMIPKKSDTTHTVR